MMGGLFVVETSAGEERARVLKDVSLCLVIATSNGNAGAWAVEAKCPPPRTSTRPITLHALLPMIVYVLLSTCRGSASDSTAYGQATSWANR